MALAAVVGTGKLLHVSETPGDTIAFRRVALFGLAATAIVAGALVCETTIARSRTWRRLARLGDAYITVRRGH